MPLAPGDRLGPYEITAAIGEGGMGQVYRAKDTRLDRTVAVKILPERLAADPQFRDRFDREARVISQLDHPNICALHDVGQHDGTAYLVMQYLDGETLEQRIQRGALPVAEAVSIAAQMADALSRAHGAGIVHRDLKPANIMLTKSGARLLDFGLAGTTGPRPPTLTDAHTHTARLTAQGTIIGTFDYMAPEQIEGAEGDARTDVWGLGCVIYEMLTGTRPFEGSSPASVLANIINAPIVPIRSRQPNVSPSVDHVVQRCLEKTPDARWQSMVDLAHELRWSAAQERQTLVAARPPWKQPGAYAAAAALVAAGFALSYARGTPAPARATAPLKLSFVAPPELTFTPFGSNGNPHFALSPDGSRIAYVASAAGRSPSVWVQRLDSRTPREIPGSSDGAAPFWSRDSQSVAFFSEGKLRRSGLESEQSQALATTDATGGTWSGDEILVGSGNGPIMRVRATGGPLKAVTVVEPDEAGHRWPQFLADGRHFIYSRARSAGVRIAALDSDASSPPLATGSTAVPAGKYLLFVRPAQSGQLQIQELDLPSRRLIGTPRDLLESVRYVGGSGFPPVSVSDNGLLGYWDGTTVATGLSWRDRDGAVLTGLPTPDVASIFALAPDGRRLAYIHRATNGGTWLMDMAGVATRLTRGGARPIWSLDGASLNFTTLSEKGLTFVRQSVNGSGEQVVGHLALADSGNAAAGNFYANDWTRDGKTALLSVSQLGTGRDLILFSAATGGTTPFVATAALEVQPRFSPDERWVAYSSNETGRWEVFVEGFPAGGSRHQISVSGGAQAIWRRDGKELFYVAPDGMLMAVAVVPGPDWVPAKPRPLFPTRMRPLYAPYPYTYDVSSDGRRFLMSEVRAGTGPVISILTDWRPR